MSRKKERILITGGAGFIGGHLTDALLARGYRVRVMDNLAPPVHNGRLPSWFNRRAEFMHGDVRERKDWERALVGVTHVFHLAAYMDFHPDFHTYISTNVASVALMHEVIRKYGYPVKKIIAASSQAVYGEGKYRCQRHGAVYPAPRAAEALDRREWEVRCQRDGQWMRPVRAREDDTVFPMMPYGISKKAMEDVFFPLGRLAGIPSVALRYTIVHGPRQTLRHFYSGALRQLAVMALSGQAMEMHEDGRQMRDFVHIKDLIAAHLVVLKDPRADFEIFNVGSGRADRVLGLARAIARVCGVSFNPRLSGLWRVATARHSIVDIRKLKRLGWCPRHTLLQNVMDYVSWIRGRTGAGKDLGRALNRLRRQGVVRSASVPN